MPISQEGIAVSTIKALEDFCVLVLNRDVGLFERRAYFKSYISQYIECKGNVL